MILLRLLVLIRRILLARRTAAHMLVLGGALPSTGFGGTGLDVKFVGAVRDVLGGLAAGPVGLIRRTGGGGGERADGRTEEVRGKEAGEAS